MFFCSFIFVAVSNLILLGLITKLEQFFDIILSLNLFVALVERRRLHNKLIGHALDNWTFPGIFLSKLTILIGEQLHFGLQLHDIFPLHILFLGWPLSLNLYDVLHVSHFFSQIEDFLLVLLYFMVMVDLLLLHFGEIGLFL